MSGKKAKNTVADLMAAQTAKEAENALMRISDTSGATETITGGSPKELPSFTVLPLGSKFTKIKSNGGGIKLHIEETIDDKNTKEVDFVSHDAPHEDFERAMGDLVELVRHILAFPPEYARHSLHIGGVSFTWSKQEVKGVVISGWINLDTTNSPFFFNTPHLPYEAPSEGSTVPVVPEWGILRLNTLELEAAAYLTGKRAQRDMFDEREAA